ncbi:TM2 domain-containing protein [Yeosuana sp. AK3]
MSEEKNFNDDLKDKAKEFTEEAKESASEFAENAKETFTGSNKKILAGVLAIFLGVFGVHKFVLGYTKEGVIILVITLILGILTCGIAGWVISVLASSSY